MKWYYKLKDNEHVCNKCKNVAMWTICAKCWWIESEWMNIEEVRAKKISDNKELWN